MVQHMRRFAAALCMCCTPATASINNDVLRLCVANTPDYNEAAACYSEWRSMENARELAELRDFLKHNPRYRFAGQSLNKCWGKPKVQAFESVDLEVRDNGMRAVVKYKPTIPAGCFETGPWDNRERKD